MLGLHLAPTEYLEQEGFGNLVDGTVGVCSRSTLVSFHPKDRRNKMNELRYDERPGSGRATTYIACRHSICTLPQSRRQPQWKLVCCVGWNPVTFLQNIPILPLPCGVLAKT